MSHIDIATDANGERYTTHTFAQHGDPWYGATILTDSVIARLRANDLLPLTEVSR